MFPRFPKIEVPFTKGTLQADYLYLRSTIKIAEKYGVSKKYVLLRMEEFGIPRNPRIPPIKEVRRLAKQGLSSSQIGQLLDLSPSYVGTIGRKNQINIQDPYHVGHITTWNGYIKVWKPDHPFADCKGYVGLHRLVLEKKIGRYLAADELSHHLNGDKTDNRPDNLEVRTKGEHCQFHQPHKHRQRKNPRARGDLAQTGGVTIPDR